MVTQSGMADLRMNGQYTLNEVQYYLAHAGLGLPGNMSDVFTNRGDMVVKMNGTKKSAVAFMHASSNGARTVYRIRAADSALFSNKSFAVALVGNFPMEAEILSVGGQAGQADSALVTLLGNRMDFSASTMLYPMDRVRLHVCTGLGADTAAGDFRVLYERPGARSGITADSLTLAEGIETLDYAYFLVDRKDSLTVLPANLDSLQCIKIKVIAKTVKKDQHLAGDGYHRQTLTAKVNFRRSL
jgi:hypothetical protein